MFSVHLPLSLEALREKLDPPRASHHRPKSLPLGLATVDGALPDGGLPRGAIVEISSARGLGRATSFALEACRAAQAEARLRSGHPATIGAWCAFIDPWATLHGVGVAALGVDLSRLLVVRPPVSSIGRVAVKMAQSRAFSVMVIDTRSLPGSPAQTEGMRFDRDVAVNIVRRLALSIEGTDTSLILLTDAGAPRALPLPVSMRIELDRRLSSSAIVSSLRIPKERHGRIAGEVVIDEATRANAASTEVPANDERRAHLALMKRRA